MVVNHEIPDLLEQNAVLSNVVVIQHEDNKTHMKNGSAGIPKINVELNNKSETNGVKPYSAENHTVSDRIRPAENFFTSERNGCVRLRDSFDINVPPISIPSLFNQVVAKYPDKHALGYKNQKGQWTFYSYKEYLKLVRIVAKAFLKLGLQRYHAVCILGFNSPEWLISNLASIYAGGIATGIYTTNLPEACLHCLNTSAANIIVVENDLQLQKILQIKDKAKDLKAIIQYSGEPTDPSILSWSQLLEIGNAQPDETLDRVAADLAVNECCCILFTSGTTSAPKAVMLSHDNVLFCSKITSDQYGMTDGAERILSYLPLSHAAAQVADIYITLITASCCYFADKNALKGNLVENLKEVKPTILFGVPRVWEKMKEGLEASEKSASKFQRYILSLARSAALEQYKAKSKGVTGESFMFKFFRQLVYSKVKRKLGLDECHEFLVGAAPTSPDVREYLSSFDILVAEVFGLSETSGPHIVSSGADVDFTCAGKSLPGTKTKIDKPDETGVGEVCMYGRNIFMGYLDEPEKTRETVDEEGWLHAGDTGRILENFSVQIIGRIKELIITSGGENVAPVLIEMAIKAEIPIVSQAVVIGDGRKYLSVLLTLKSETNLESGEPLDELSKETKSWCRKLNCDFKSISEIIREKPTSVYDAIEKGIESANNKAISQAQRIQKFTILPKDFSVFTGELGPTLKIMRRIVYDKYKNEIEAMYQNGLL